MKEIDAAADEMERTVEKAAGRHGASSANVSASSDDIADSANAASARRSALPRVTGVRHWSTPDYTRVAIDVEKEVKFGSERISHPDRIFFDLRGTKLASTLVGKTFDVDDGFLKKIRVAEFQPGRTRIVLEVDDLASYEAFLLPDPYRLIIDVHGKDIHGRQKRTTVMANAREAKARAANAKTDTTANESSAPDTSPLASAESDDDSSEPESAASRDPKSVGRKEQQESCKDAIPSSKSEPVSPDFPLLPSATS